MPLCVTRSRFIETARPPITLTGQEKKNGPDLATRPTEESVADGNTHHATATVNCFTAARLYRLEISLRTSVKLIDDEDTMVHLADLAIKVQRRRHAHEEFCQVCLRRGQQ